jgi:phosphoglycolate phosphatase
MRKNKELQRMKKYRRPISMMIFDLDGTLVTSGKDIAMAVDYTLQKMGLPRIDMDDILTFIGDGVQILIERSLGVQSADRFTEGLRIFTAYYAEHMLDTTVLYPGVHEVLTHFNLQTKVIVTNKRFELAEAMVDELHVRSYFEKIIGSDTTPYRKPDPRILAPLKDVFDLNPNETLIIGDGTNDILLAKNAGFLSCALLNGLGDRKTLLSLKPDFSCECLQDMVYLFD